ncbi:hypothetical protein LCGC14_1332480 [marine sediment metagenome]|uniref:Uncharacterized protein n=1 Tax=marine sediment metagenome TaxID=412755 RepID=A0A0F9KGU5_9ZZZZ
MVKVKDIEKLMKDFLVEPEEMFREIKRYLLSEFKWDVDPLKKSQFMIRGIPIENDKILGDILKTYLPEEVLVLKEI